MDLSPSTITVTGPKAAGPLRPYAFHAYESLSALYTYELEFLSEDDAVDLSKLLGESMTVHLPLGAPGQRFFNGLVVRASRQGWRGRYASYSVELAPDLWLLTRTDDCRIFQSQTVPDVIKEILRAHGIAFREALIGDYPKWDYLTQYRETDFQFLARIMSHEGIYYFFEHALGTNTVVLADSHDAHKVTPGFETVPLAMPLQRNENPDYLAEWSNCHAVRTNAVTLADYEFRLRGKAAVITSHQEVKPDQPKGALARYDFLVRSTQGENGGSADSGGSHEDCRRLAEIRLEEERTTAHTFEGKGTARGLTTGALFGLSNAHDDQQFLITSTQISLRNSLFETGSDPVDERCSISLTAIDGTIAFRPRYIAKPRIYGPHTAIVVGGAGEEIWTDLHGRIKVQFHWDRKGNADEHSSCWARVAQPWAGKRWGAIHIPRIGNEVVVEFIEGDPDRPLVTGSVYNAENMPPYDLPANRTQTGIKTRSSKGGSPNDFNELRFEDKMGSEEVFIQAQKDLNINVKNNEGRTVGNDRTKAVGHNETSTIGDDQSIEVGGMRTESVGKDESVSVAGSRDHSVDGDSTSTVGKNHSVTVDKNESIDVGGNQSLSVGGSQDVSVGKGMTVTVGAGRTTSVGKDDALDVSGNQTVSIKKKMSVKVDAERSQVVKANDTLSVEKKMSVSVKEEATFVVGSASLTLKKDGTIQLKGKDIKMEGSGNITIKASGNVVIKGSKVAQN
jgi:type VI secretion system secreted protein VgrG